ncbi:peptidase M48, partial [Pseudomonas syringae]
MDRDGENITLKESLSRLHEAEQGLDFVVVMGSVTIWMARTVIALCLLAALVGGIVLAGLNLDGARARQIRERLLHNVSRGRRNLQFSQNGRAST